MTSRKKQAQSVFLTVIMVLSVVAMGTAGFAGGAAAVANDGQLDAEGVDIASGSQSQDVAFTAQEETDFTVADGGTSTVTIAETASISSTDATVTQAEGDSTGSNYASGNDVSASTSEGEPVTISFDETAIGETGEAEDILVTVDVTVDASGSSVQEATYTISGDNTQDVFFDITDSSPESVDATVVPEPDSIVEGEIANIDVSIEDHPDDLQAPYTVSVPDSEEGTAEIMTGDTNEDGTFSFTADPAGDNGGLSVGDEYTISVNYGDVEGYSGSSEATVTVAPSVNLDAQVPSDLTIGDEVEVSGSLTNDDGDLPGNYGSLAIDYEDDSEFEDIRVLSNGDIEDFTTTVDDAGEYTFVYNGEYDLETFTVDDTQGNVTIEADGDSAAGFEETYTVTAQDGDGNAFDFGSDYDGYVNVTGEFDVEDGSVGVTGAEDDAQYSTDENDNTDDIVRVNPGADGEFELTATPTTDSEAVTATLENNDNNGDFSGALGDHTVYDGIEETSGANTAESPDYVGSDSVDVSTAGELNAQVSTTVEDDSLDAQSQEDVTVTVRGADGEFPDGSDEESADLDTATVTISGPGVDLAAEDFDSSSATSGDSDSFDSEANAITFNNVEPDEAGEVTVDVTAVSDNGDEYSDSFTIDVTGDIIQDVSPASAAVDDSQDLSVEVTNDEGTPVNNRLVTLDQNDDNGEFTVSDQEYDETLEGVTSLQIDGGAGTIVANGGNTIATGLVVNNGEYVAENVTFSASGAFDVTVDDGSDTATESEAISVDGLEAYSVESDVDEALVGTEEVHNLTITEDGAAVNGTDLSEFSVTATQYDDESELSPSPVDTNEDGTDDALEVEPLPENATAPLNLTVDDGSDRTGTATVDVVQPDISTTLAGDDLTLGLQTEDVIITAEDPRDGEALANAELQFTATNTTFEAEGGGDFTFDEGGSIANDETDSVTLNQSGAAVVSIAPDAAAAGDEPISLDLDVNVDGGEAFGTETLEVGTISTEAPDNLAPNSEEELNLVVRDANGDRLDSKEVALTGAVDNEPITTTTDEGYATLSFMTTSGTIDVEVEADSGYGDGSLGDEAQSAVVADEITVREEVALNLSVTETEVEVNDTVDFSLVRDDYDAETAGTLTITNASGDVVDTVERENADADLTSTFDAEGEYTVEAEKGVTDGKSFTNDSVDITVGDAEPPSDVNEEYVTELAGDDGEIDGPELATGIQDFFDSDEVNGPTLSAIIEKFFE